MNGRPILVLYVDQDFIAAAQRIAAEAWAALFDADVARVSFGPPDADSAPQ
jgi:hypothetical protein